MALAAAHWIVLLAYLILVSRQVGAFHSSLLKASNRHNFRASSYLSSSLVTPSGNNESLDQLLETAQSAARAAGSIIVKHLGCSNQQPESSESDGDDKSQVSVTTVKFSIKDVVTQYDKEAQAAVLSVIRTKYPSHAFLGEEDVAAGSQASEDALDQRLKQTMGGFSAGADSKIQDTTSNPDEGFLWICDPIDGTANFASGLPLCGVTIALVYQGIPLIGVIYDPHRDELFSAIRNQGATMNGQAIHVTKSITGMKDAIINAGCPADPNAFATSMR
jgi:myo-inositol-1(or 4)-monophosphatase